eukprot:RCo009773
MCVGRSRRQRPRYTHTHTHTHGAHAEKRGQAPHSFSHRRGAPPQRDSGIRAGSSAVSVPGRRRRLRGAELHRGLGNWGGSGVGEGADRCLHGGWAGGGVRGGGAGPAFPRAVRQRVADHLKGEHVATHEVLGLLPREVAPGEALLVVKLRIALAFPLLTLVALTLLELEHVLAVYPSGIRCRNILRPNDVHHKVKALPQQLHESLLGVGVGKLGLVLVQHWEGVDDQQGAVVVRVVGDQRQGDVVAGLLEDVPEAQLGSTHKQGLPAGAPGWGAALELGAEGLDLLRGRIELCAAVAELHLQLAALLLLLIVQLLQ